MDGETGKMGQHQTNIHLPSVGDKNIGNIVNILWTGIF